MLDLFVSLFAFLWNLENKVLLRWPIPDIIKIY